MQWSLDQRLVWPIGPFMSGFSMTVVWPFYGYERRSFESSPFNDFLWAGHSSSVATNCQFISWHPEGTLSKLTKLCAAGWTSMLESKFSMQRLHPWCDGRQPKPVSGPPQAGPRIHHFRLDGCSCEQCWALPRENRHRLQRLAANSAWPVFLG